MINRCRPQKVYIFNFGDGLDGPEGGVYPNQKDHQDVQYEEQFLGYVEDISEFIQTIYDHQPCLEYVAVSGNHSSSTGVNWDVLANKSVAKKFSDYPTLEFDVEDRTYKEREICGYNFVLSHGRYLRKGTYTERVDLLHTQNNLQLPPLHTYFLIGHRHGEDEISGPFYNRFVLPSMVGPDDWAEQELHLGARPAQVVLRVDESGLADWYNIHFD